MLLTAPFPVLPLAFQAASLLSEAVPPLGHLGQADGAGFIGIQESAACSRSVASTAAKRVNCAIRRAGSASRPVTWSQTAVSMSSALTLRLGHLAGRAVRIQSLPRHW
jgi:hypothetical protein